jgi:hypothetical protein
MLKAFCGARTPFPKREYTSPESEDIREGAELIFFQAPIEEQDEWVMEMIKKGHFDPFDYPEWHQALEEYIRDHSNQPQTQRPPQKADYSKQTTTQQPSSKNRAFAKQHGLSLGSATKNRQKGTSRRKIINEREQSAADADGGLPPVSPSVDGETKNCKLLPATTTKLRPLEQLEGNGLRRRATGAIDRATGAEPGRASEVEPPPKDGVSEDAKILPTKQQQERKTDAKQSHIK